jgi:hypothetical protein
LRYHFLRKAHIVPCIPRHCRAETVDSTAPRNAESPLTKKPKIAVLALDLLQLRHLYSCIETSHARLPARMAQR